MAMFITRNERLQNNYRKVEALYRKGESNEAIAAACGLSLMDVLDITQKIFASDMRKKEF